MQNKSMVNILWGYVQRMYTGGGQKLFLKTGKLNLTLSSNWIKWVSPLCPEKADVSHYIRMVKLMYLILLEWLNQSNQVRWLGAVQRSQKNLALALMLVQKFIRIVCLLWSLLNLNTRPPLPQGSEKSSELFFF